MRLLFPMFILTVFFLGVSGLGVNGLKGPCYGGVLFIDNNEHTYSLPLIWDCHRNHAFNHAVQRVKRESGDIMLRTWVGSRVKREDEEDEDDDFEGSGESEEEIELTPSERFVPILPTPTLPLDAVGVTGLVETTLEATQRPVYSSVVRASSFFVASSVFPEASLGASFGSFLGSGVGPTDEGVKIEEVDFRRLPKQLLISGVPFRFDMPTSNCSSIRALGTPGQVNWIQIYKGNVIAIPTVEDVSDYEFNVTCPKAVYNMYVSVRQRHRSRNWSHVYTIEYGSVRNDVASFVELVEGLRSGMNPKWRTEDLVLLTAHREAFPFKLSFVNESVVMEMSGAGSCPLEELGVLKERLKSLEVGGDFVIKSVDLRPLNGQCSGLKQSVETVHNYPPSIKNQIDVINATKGAFLLYNVNRDFCYDPEDGESDKLLIELKDLGTFASFGEDHWLQFDQKNLEVHGLPMHTQTISAVIVCTDKGGKTAQDVIEVVVRDPPKVEFNALFTLHFESLEFTPKVLRKFIEKLSSLLTPEILVKGYTESGGHVIFSWYNTSNPGNEHVITEIRKTLFTDEGSVNKDAKNWFSPEFNLTSSGSVVPVGGILLAGGSPVETDKKMLFDFEGTDRGGSPPREGAKNDDFFDRFYDSTYLTTYIIPSVLIAVMILLALIIAIILSRKKQPSPDYYYEDDFRGKKSSLTFAPPVGGVPVIFQEELETGTRQLIQKNQFQGQAGPQIQRQGPPPPPSYYSQNSGSRSSRSYQPPPPMLRHPMNPYRQSNQGQHFTPTYVPP